MIRIIASPKQKTVNNLTARIYISNFVLVLKVVVVGDWLPRSFLGSFYLLFAAVRSFYLAFYLFLCRPEKDCDLIIADQITFHLPILRLCCRAGVLFYCHFPDKFLAPKAGGILRKGVYRRFMDWAEEKCLAAGADEIVVNSKFTQIKFIEAFKSIKKMPQILYPGVQITNQDTIITENVKKMDPFLLSLNRFERKKDLSLAIESFKLKKFNLESNNQKIKLILAGGFDSRVPENREHLKELQEFCDENGLKHLTLFRPDYKDISSINLTFNLSEIQVLFLPSISQETKQILMNQSLGLIYTPSNEHFGIVPIEAMAQGLPVIAMNSGGPKETVADGVTGYLCEANPKDIAKAIDKLLECKNSKHILGSAGKKRVKDLFSLKVFGDHLSEIILNIQKSKNIQKAKTGKI